MGGVVNKRRARGGREKRLTRSLLLGSVVNLSKKARAAGEHELAEDLRAIYVALFTTPSLHAEIASSV